MVNLFARIRDAYRAVGEAIDRAYERERARHATDTAFVRLVDAVAGAPVRPPTEDA